MFDLTSTIACKEVHDGHKTGSQGGDDHPVDKRCEDRGRRAVCQIEQHGLDDQQGQQTNPEQHAITENPQEPDAPHEQPAAHQDGEPCLTAVDDLLDPEDEHRADDHAQQERTSEDQWPEEPDQAYSFEKVEQHGKDGNPEPEGQAAGQIPNRKRRAPVIAQMPCDEGNEGRRCPGQRDDADEMTRHHRPGYVDVRPGFVVNDRNAKRGGAEGGSSRPLTPMPPPLDRIGDRRDRRALALHRWEAPWLVAAARRLA